MEEAAVEQGGDRFAVPQLAGLPRVQREGGTALGQREVGFGEAPGEVVGGDGTAALGPGRVGYEKGGSDNHPVQGKGAAQLG
jgi:hypothetical protein